MTQLICVTSCLPAQRLDDIASTFEFSAEQHEELVKTCMTTLSSKMWVLRSQGGEKGGGCWVVSARGGGEYLHGHAVPKLWVVGSQGGVRGSVCL